MSLTVNVRPPQNVTSLEINKFVLENYSEETMKASYVSMGSKSSINLFSVQSIHFRSSNQAKGSIEDISLHYQEFAKMLGFSIRRIHYECPSNPDQRLIEVPKLDEKNEDKLALNIKLVFSDGILGKIEIITAPVKMYLSKIDVTEQLCSMALFNSVFSQEKAALPKILCNSVFDKEMYDKIHYEVIRNKKVKKHSTKEVEQLQPKFGPFMAHYQMKLEVICEKFAMSCAKDHKEFAQIEMRTITVKMNTKWDYDVDIEKISLSPYDSNYTNFFMKLSENQRLVFKIEKSQEYPLIRIQNAKIIYLERVIKELVHFNKELKEEIVEHSKSLLSSTCIFDKEYQEGADGDRESNIQHPHQEAPEKMPFCKIIAENSVVIIPRNSKSEDFFALHAKKVLATIGKRAFLSSKK